MQRCDGTTGWLIIGQQYNGSTGVASTAVGQMDPNGLYPSNNTLATWVMCLEKDGTIHPVYIEPLVITYPYPVAVRNGQVVQTGNSTTGSAIQLGR